MEGPQDSQILELMRRPRTGSFVVFELFFNKLFPTCLQQARPSSILEENTVHRAKHPRPAARSACSARVAAPVACPRESLASPEEQSAAAGRDA